MRQALILILLLGCTFLVAAGILLYFTKPDNIPLPETGVDAAALLIQHECYLCHQQDPDTAAEEIFDLSRNCAFCHEKEKITWFRAPDLAKIGQKLRPEWIRQYLLDPFQVRPYLHEEMPDFSFTPEQTDAIAAYLVRIAPKSTSIDLNPPLQRLADEDTHYQHLQRGFALFTSYSCDHCHSYTGAMSFDTYDLDSSLRSEDIRFISPDLRYVRDRIRPEWISGYILNAHTYNKRSPMPANTHMTKAEADTLAYFLLHQELEPFVPTEESFQPRSHIDYATDVQPLLDVFCAFACHYPHESDQMGWGTGYAGGFGYPRRELDLTSYKALMKGSLDENGRRQPIVIPGDSASILIKRLQGDIQPAMPMGIRMPEQAKQILEQWIIEGAKGPSGE